MLPPISTRNGQRIVIDDTLASNNWHPVATLYFDGGESGVVMNRKGEVGWHYLETADVVKFGNSFEDFVNKYVEGGRKYPLDRFSAFPPQLRR